MAKVFDDVLVYFPLPAWSVPHVTSFLNDLAKTTPLPSDENLLGEPATSASLWSIEDLRRLRPLIRHNKMAMAVLELAAERPGDSVTYPEACKKAGLDLSQGRSGIGALTKVCNRIGKTNSWPVTYEWAGNGEQVACYRMNKDIAELWMQVSAE